MKKFTLLFLMFTFTIGMAVSQNSYHLSWDVTTSAATEEYRTENYSVLISTTGTDEADFTEVFTETLDEETPQWEYQHREEELEDLEEGDDIHVAFRHHDSEDNDRLVIDNVRIFTADGVTVFEEDFDAGVPEVEDDYESEWLPEGWEAVDANEDGFNWYFDYYEGDGYMLSQSSYYDDEEEQWVALDPDNWLISPSVTLEVPAVTFNVDMTDAVADLGDDEELEFDPDVHDVFITGTFAGWTEPGDDDAYKMEDQGDNIYSITLNVEEGHHEYKYFLVEDDPTWDFGEWAGDPNRKVFVDADLTVDDIFGEYYEVETLAELRDRGEDTTFVYTGEAVITAMAGYGNQKYLQDETAAIMIWDWDGNIANDHDRYDVITNIHGAINDYFGMIQFVPSAQGTPEAIDNTPILPAVVEFDEVDQPGDQAKLLRFQDIVFTEVEVEVNEDDYEWVAIEEGDEFENGTNYKISDGEENEFIVRTDFFNVDYIGTEIPLDTTNISGVITYDWGELKMVPRCKDDVHTNVTFNVDMTDAVAENDIEFDPDVHDVYITGSFTGWAEPGDTVAYKMEPCEDNSDIYTITLEVEDGDHEYKYFLVEEDPTWDIGEWPGDPNREITIVGSTTINNVWGEYYPSIDPVEVEFDTRDPQDVVTTITWGEATEITEIILDEEPLDTDHYWVDVDSLVFDQALFAEAEHEDTFVFTIEFDFGDDVDFTVNVVDTEYSVEEVEGFELNLFPNPVRDQFTIESGKVMSQAKLININGQVVKDISIDGMRAEIEVRSLRPGVYFIQIHTDDEVVTERIQVVR